MHVEEPCRIGRRRCRCRLESRGPQPPAATVADPRAALVKLLPAGSKLEDLKPSPIPGIYQFVQGAEVSYLTADGKYFLDGNVYDMSTRENLTEAIRAHARLALINAVPESQMLIFSPKNPHYTITVFTDVDCQYCRKLHSEMAELNKLGVRVRYMFYPRTGPNTESWRKAEVVWCSADRNEALTRAKAGGAARYEQDLRADTGGARISRSDRASGCAARRRSSPRAAISSTGTCRRAIWCRNSRTAAAGEALEPRSARRSALQQFQLVLDAFPLLGVRGRLLLLADHGPLLRQLRVQLLESFPVPRECPLRKKWPRPGIRARTACNRCTHPDRSPENSAPHGNNQRDRLPRSPCICT